METKQFQAESKRLLDLMINSIYTNKDIFLREIISNSSDAIDKLYYRSLTDSTVKLKREDYKIDINLDKEKRTITIIDNGCGMSKHELDNNLGTIAKSGSRTFKEENEKKEDVNIIGQFGVGFYSAFMVSKEVQVTSRKYGEDKAYIWKSTGVEGYTIDETEKKEPGTEIILFLKEDTEDENYSNYLDEYKIREMIKKYSDYIRYPIKMLVEKSKLKEETENEYETVKEEQILNSMIPIWKRKKSEVLDEEYNSFYMSKFADFDKPAKVIYSSVEGTLSYTTLLFIPSHMPFDYYTKEYEKGLKLYSNGVLIMEKCEDLLPDHFSFVKGLVDSPDLSLNISRELLQHDKQLKTIAKSIEKKIKNELMDMLQNNREEYETFFETFGTQLKFGVYNHYGMNKESLKDLIMFYSNTQEKLVTLKEYIERMKEGQDKIYYAPGETIDKIDMLPQLDAIKEKGYEILYLTADVDEFAFKVLNEYEGKQFVNVSAGNIDLDSEEEKEQLKQSNEENKPMFELMKETIPEVQEIRYTHRLRRHPVCLTSEGEISVEMEKVINSMPNNQNVKARTILEINEKHDIANKLKELYNTDKEQLKNYTKVLYAGARLIEGLNIDNPTEFSNIICELLSK